MMRGARELILSGMLLAVCYPLVSDATVVLNINTTAGESTVLPCNLTSTSSISLKDLRFYWQDERNDVLYSFNKGEEMPKHVNKPYQDRITAFPQDMTRGNISVKLNNPTLEDEQRVFRAFAHILNSGGMNKKQLELICQITLHVGVPYKTVSLVVNEEAMTAVCTIQRGFPEPLVSWRLQHLSNDSKHVSDLRDGHPKPVQDAGDLLFNSSSTIDIRGAQYQNVTCVIHNPTLNETLNVTHVFNKGNHMWGLTLLAVGLTAAATVLLVTAVNTT